MHISLIKLIFLIVFISVSVNTGAQNKSEKKSITWSKNVKVKKLDFKGKIDKNSKNIAQTGANIIIVPYAKKGGKYLYRVLAKFYKYKSWINTNSELILNHEQLHFDIAELYARKMRKEILKTKLSNKKIEESDYRRIHKKLFKEYIQYQKKYDLETDFSRSESLQNKWKKFIAQQLSGLEKFALNI
ncbi:hypothetical protein BW723_08705 [Polaribacter reichenbachii]|uniref:DUF922 domain-containing protein n=1 Tax=Polaribacter reichenbachii TaxID=996801 RepID=A0A1B8U718_9FLAO|nr:DUF922 domain-containing protein [Polaribacter reichenbachii]APZ46372.1 hypothetical protein BW723_08705 [Polaribacter reichenbachii]AUC20236.1 hypothetical protein BTO17_16735 [Polaribacter reichenbachii]OBY67674.1 hypothetical protein LPB301_00800 [Polaribacter reichenbachii]